ncbi:MAG: class II aldolase/adducin family protein [Roseiarcus sp.]
MSDLTAKMRDLVVANRILGREEVVDAFGHASIRHPDRPDRYIMSCSRSPELVAMDDLMVFELDGTALEARDRPAYAERFIHSAIYEARPEVGAVIHNHSHAVIPFTVTGVPLRPIVHVGGPMGERAPVWDIRAKFGDTDMLVVTMEQGRDLARAIGSAPVVLMRGHGCVVAAGSVREAVMTAIYVQVNARLQLDALRLGDPVYLSPGEVALTRKRQLSSLAIDRAWEYWAQRADVGNL